jgi:hypothetical protein
MLKALTTLLVSLYAVVLLVACGSTGPRRDEDMSAASTTTEAKASQIAAPGSAESIDPALDTYVIHATRARVDLARGIEDVMAYARRLAAGARPREGDEQVFARIGRCRAQVRGLRPPPEMQQVHTLLHDACSQSQRGSLELVDAFGMGDATLARRAGKHLAAATLELEQARLGLESFGG